MAASPSRSAAAHSPFAGLLKGFQQVTDAYLLGLAIRKGGVLATFDSGITALAGAGSGYLKSVRILEP
jgi:predicted nucleic acid-binding protein